LALLSALTHGACTITLVVALGLTKDKPEDTNLRIYQTFETEFLSRTEIFYTQESSHFIETNSISDYMKKVETRLAEEVRRRDAILHPSTESELTKRVEQVLVQKHMDRMHNEFSELLKQEKIEGLYPSIIHVALSASVSVSVSVSRLEYLSACC
jgi:cullin 1